MNRLFLCVFCCAFFSLGLANFFKYSDSNKIQHWPPQHVNSLRDGKEIILHLRPGILADYYFHVKKDGRPFWLAVTPCGGTVNWRLSRQDSREFFPFPPTPAQYQRKAEASGITEKENVNYNQIVTETPTRYSDSSTDSLDVPFRDNTNKGMFINHESLYTNKLPEFAFTARSETDLVHEVGNEKMEYFDASLPSGILHFYAKSDHEDVVVRVFATSRPDRVNEFYPKLPPRQKSVLLTNFSATEAKVKWEHSPSVNFFQERHIQYCLALSRTREYKNYCEFSGGTTEGGSDVGKSNSITRRVSDGKKKYTKDFTVFNDEQSEVPLLKCTKYKTTFHFAGLFPNTEYKLSLFAINRNTGGAATYGGLSFRTLEKNKPPVRKFSLKDSEMIAAYLNPSRSAFQTYELRIPRFQREVLITVQPCSGYIRVNLYKDKHLLRRSVIGELRRFVISKVTPGTLRVKITNDDNTAKVFKIWASVRHWRDPYPRLPEDTSIKVFEHSRGCNEVTLAWLPSKGHIRYCLYKRMEEDDYFKRLILEQSTECRSPPKSGLVQCRVHSVSGSVFQNFEPDTLLILNATMHNLKPGTTYRFDLFVQPVNKPIKQTLTYRTVWVKTKRKCYG